MASFYNTLLILCFLCIIIPVKVSSVNPKIVGGKLASKGQFKYQASLKLDGLHICGATIIDPKHVLTAGYCVVTASNQPVSTEKLTVRVGSVLISGIDGVSEAIEKIHLLEGYNINTISIHDIAILKITGTFNFNQFVQAVPIAQNEYQPGTECTISGWGKTDPSNEGLAENLHYANTTLLDKGICQRIIGIQLAYDMLCAARFESTDTCEGDSGGPIVCGEALTGVITNSLGFGCLSQPRKPAIYTDVQIHNKWISDILKNSSTVIGPFVPVIFTIIILSLCTRL